MKMRRSRGVVIGGLVTLGLIAVFGPRMHHLYQHIPGGDRLMQRMRGKATIEDRLQQFGPAARDRWAPYFKQAGLAYPPARLVLVGLKEEKRLEVYAAGDDHKLKFVRDYPILAASGHIGPKLREGDFQVPEGIYATESLNPNSAYHLSLRVSYPNEFDRTQAAHEGRTNLGGDIMIHGNNCSIGCLAMGDLAAEDIFCLAAEKWPQKIALYMCPRDLRHKTAPDIESPAWTKEIYHQLKHRLVKLPKPPAHTMR